MKLLSERTLCKGKRVELIQRVYSYDGEEFIRDIVHFGHAVAALPLMGDEVLLIKQFRVPVNSWVLEIPAGRVEHGENLEDAVKRELIEEIGYIPHHIEKIVSIYMAPGYSDEVLHIFLATDLEYVGSKPEPGELIEVVKVKVNHMLDTLLKCEVTDAKTLVAISTYLQLRGTLSGK
ncbi:MAG: NUDIX hydrolase [Sulfolobales archaeon]|nr:NUDIX hydrolase [Sulfolobales archaeon]MDW7970189.1 NUDIX hydrolase [Sulfolobales archaeon]